MQDKNCLYCDFMESLLECPSCTDDTLCDLHSGWVKILMLRKEKEEKERDRIMGKRSLAMKR